MFALLTRWRQQSRAKPAAPRRARLGVEALEARYCLWGGISLSLHAQTFAGHLAQLSGAVLGSDPAGATVTFSGAASGSATTDSAGNYSWSTTNATLGTLSAVAVDTQGHTSGTVISAITAPAPVVSLSFTYGSGHTVTLSGKVFADLDPGGRTITFSGVVGGSTTTNSDGTYSYTTTVSALGNMQASTTDLWGLSSNSPQVAYTNAPPQITSFAASEAPLRMWTFSGRVADEYPAGLVVTLGGLPSLQGVTAVVQSGGGFSVTIQLEIGEGGTATAQTTDWWGVASNIALADVTQT
jgi:hypothetical protein